VLSLFRDSTRGPRGYRRTERTSRREMSGTRAPTSLASRSIVVGTLNPLRGGGDAARDSTKMALVPEKADSHPVQIIRIKNNLTGQSNPHILDNSTFASVMWRRAASISSTRKWDASKPFRYVCHFDQLKAPRRVDRYPMSSGRGSGSPDERDFPSTAKSIRGVRMRKSNPNSWCSELLRLQDRSR